MRGSCNSPVRPVFELSEATLLADPNHWRAVCDRYRRSGWRVGLSYAAAGPVSVRALLDIRPDYIKIAKPLVRDIETLPCSVTISALAEVGERLRIPVIAEGVERSVTVENLWLLNVSIMRGPLFEICA